MYSYIIFAIVAIVTVAFIYYFVNAIVKSIIDKKVKLEAKNKKLDEQKKMEVKIFKEVYKPFIDKTLTYLPKKSEPGEVAQTLEIPCSIQATTTALGHYFNKPRYLIKDTKIYIKEKFPQVTKVVFVCSNFSNWPTKIKIYIEEKTIDEVIKERIDSARASMGLKKLNS